MGSEMAEQAFTNVPSDAINLVCSLLGLAYFINLIKSDAQQAYRKRAHWIPGNTFILSALTIQVLSYLDTSTVSISNTPNVGEMAFLLGNHLLIESERLIICVFMGYLLPGMARPGSGGQWEDISALAITLITDITSELYFLHKRKPLFELLTPKHVKKIDYDYKFDMVEEFKKQPSIQTWFMVSSMGILVAVIFLILFLGCAIVAGNTIRGILSQQISVALSAKELENSSKGLKEKVLKSWIVARACRLEYVIARSVLSSAAGMVITLRIILSLLKFSFVQYKSIVLRHDWLYGLRQAKLVFQCVFVLVGWIAICWRWITAVLYFPMLNNTRKFFTVKDFWTRAISQMRFSWESPSARLAEEIFKARLAKRIRLRVHLCLLRSVETFVVGFLMALQSLVVLVGKFCWFLSEIVIGNKFVWGCFFGHPDLHFYVGYEVALDNYSEFVKYRQVLKQVRMLEERPGNHWLANKKYVQQIKERMQAGYEDAKKCPELIALISHRGTFPGTENLVNEFESLPLVKAYFPNLDKMCWKMTVVSYLNIIVKIFPSSDRVDRAIKAFLQVEDFMNFLDNAEIQANEENFLDRLGMEADQMSKAADLEFKRLQKYVSIDRNTPTLEEIRSLMLSAQQFLADNMLLDKDADADVELQDSKDLTKIAPNYSLFRVCKHLVEINGGYMMDLEDLWNEIQDHLGNGFFLLHFTSDTQVGRELQGLGKRF